MVKSIKLEHVAIIMDGNGRWAEQKGLKRIKGHEAGAKNVKKIVEACIKQNLKVLTLYAFSTENWKRPQGEINALMNLLVDFIQSERETFHKNNIRLLLSGDIKRLSKTLQKEINDLIELTKKNSKLIVNVALNYGAQEEIITAVKNIAEKHKKNKLKLNQINIKSFKNYLYNGKILPYPDLLIRTSGELRISNFLLWQIAYSELYFTKILWPDFSPSKFNQALERYTQRHRRFGGLVE